MSFPLFRLPLLASINIIKNIDVGDFVPLIRTSTRMRNLVKYSRVPIELTVYGEQGIEFKKRSDPDRTMLAPIYVVKKKQGNIPFKPSVLYRWNCVPETYLEGYQRVMDDFVDIFRVKSVDFDLDLTRGIGLQFLEYAMKLGLKFEQAQVSIDGDNLDDNRKVLSACAQASKVYVTSYGCPESFRFEGFHEYSMDYFELEVDKRCEWLTLDHLCALVNCSNVRIYYVKLSDADLNKFLKHWLAGAGKMKTLVVDLAYPEDIMSIEVINPQTVLNGIPRKEIESADNGSKFEIERSDGVKAYVTCGCLSFTMELST